jgi:hypothetical protein
MILWFHRVSERVDYIVVRVSPKCSSISDLVQLGFLLNILLNIMGRFCCRYFIESNFHDFDH